MDWTSLTKESGQWLNLANTAMNFRGSAKRGNTYTDYPSDYEHSSFEVFTAVWKEFTFFWRRTLSHGSSEVHRWRHYVIGSSGVRCWRHYVMGSWPSSDYTQTAKSYNWMKPRLPALIVFVRILHPLWNCLIKRQSWRSSLSHCKQTTSHFRTGNIKDLALTGKTDKRGLLFTHASAL